MVCNLGSELYEPLGFVKLRQKSEGARTTIVGNVLSIHCLEVVDSKFVITIG